jgi:hypothetical protein
MVMNANGTHQHTISQGPNDYGPVWSPDGTKPALLNVATRDIEVVNADGSGRYILHHDGPQFVLSCGPWSHTARPTAASRAPRPPSTWPTDAPPTPPRQHQQSGSVGAYDLVERPGQDVCCGSEANVLLTPADSARYLGDGVRHRLG